MTTNEMNIIIQEAQKGGRYVYVPHVHTRDAFIVDAFKTQVTGSYLARVIRARKKKGVQQFLMLNSGEWKSCSFTDHVIR